MNPSDPPSQNLNVSLFKDSQLYVSGKKSADTQERSQKGGTGSRCPGKQELRSRQDNSEVCVYMNKSSKSKSRAESS